MLTIKYDLGDCESVEIVPIADCHIGNPLCQEGLIKETIDYILQEPDDPKMARICVLNGDLTESVTRNSVGNVFEQTMTPSVQVATMINYLRPLTETSKKYPHGKILSYCAGNHDSGRFKETGISAAESIAVGLGIEDRYSVNGCYSFINLRRMHTKDDHMQVTVYNSHLTGGSSTVGGRANRVSKLGLAGGIIANLCIGSHLHSPLTFKEDYFFPSNHVTLKQETITYLLTPAFLTYGDYAQRNAMKPATICMPKVFIKQGRSRRGDVNQDGRFVYVEVLL